MNHKFHSTLGVDITSLQIYNLGVYWQYWKGFFSHRMPIICNLRAFKSFPHEYVVLREFFQEFLLHQKARQLINIDFSSSFFCIGLLLATVCIFGLIWVLTNCGMNPHKFCQRKDRIWNILENVHEILWKVDGGWEFQKLFFVKCREKWRFFFGMLAFSVGWSATRNSVVLFCRYCSSIIAHYYPF